jgi:ankyrin repeat protein
MHEALQALYRGDEDAAYKLLPPDDELTAHQAATFGRVERLRRLIDEEPARVDEWSPDGFTPLHGAIFGGHESTVRLLVDHGADLEAVSKSEIAQVRPLGTAAFVRSVALGRILLEAGADPDAKTPDGHTAMDTALANGDDAFASLLREFGASER